MTSRKNKDKSFNQSDKDNSSDDSGYNQKKSSNSKEQKLPSSDNQSGSR